MDTQRLVRGGSYAGLLLSSKYAWSDEEERNKSPRYNPLFLDDPEIRAAKDRTVIKQEGYIVSCIPFVKPNAAKEELNQLFLAKHGDWMEGRFGFSPFTRSECRVVARTQDMTWLSVVCLAVR